MSANEKYIARWLHRLRLWLQRKCEVGQFAGIHIADIRGGAPAFLNTVVSALELIKLHDPRRFRRVERHVRWIANSTVSHGGQCYCGQTQTCRIDFENEAVAKHGELATVLYAARIVHEATHGVVGTRLEGVSGSIELRLRIERLCFSEERRFLQKLCICYPSVAPLLHTPFPESTYLQMWSRSKIQVIAALFRRLWHRNENTT